MIPLSILVFIILVVGAIIIATQSTTNKKLNKHNIELTRDIQAAMRADEMHIQQLQLIVLENPIDAYAGLVEHINRRTKNRP